MSDALESLLQEGRTFPPPERLPQGRARSPTRRSTTRPNATGRASGPRRRSRSTGSRSGTRSSSGTCRSRSGSSAASSTSRTTASTATSTPATATRSRTTGKASPATPAPSPTRELLDDVGRARQRCCKALGVEKGDRVTIYLGMVPELPTALLACARIGAPHSVVFGGFTADSLRDRINDAEAKVLITGDGAWRRGAVVPLKEIADDAVAETPVDREGARAAAHRATTSRCRRAATSGGTTSCPQQSAECAPEPMDTEDLLYLLYTTGTTGKPKGIMHTTGGYLTQVRVDAQVRVRPAPRHRRVLVHRRRRLGHRPLVHRLRPAREPRDERALRGHARLPRQGPLLVDRREVQGHDPLHRADRDPHVHEVGRRSIPERHDLSSLRLLGTVGEPINPEAWVWYWQAHRRRALPGRRHVVADRDRRHHDQPAARRDHAEARAARRSRCPASAPTSSTTPAQPVGDPRRRLPRAHAAVAVDAARHLGRPRALPRHVLEPLRRQVLRGRRRQARRRRLLLAARPRRRHHARVGSQHLAPTEVEHALVDHPAVAEAAVVGKKDDDDRPGDRRVRDPARRQRAERRARRRAARPRRAS